MLEFTGERVVPGHVEPDLWNEHLARYLFAARLARGKRVADLGCGTGYGSAELARTAESVTGFDVSPDAIAYAREHYAGLSFAEASCENVPAQDASFDLVVAFEVIEHLVDHEELVREARRLLSPGGQFVVSTPNKDYYTDSRRSAGPNPYHTREFSLKEFRDILGAAFPHVTLFTQNHVETIVMRPVEEISGSPAVRIDEAAPPETAHFFIAVCALSPQVGSPAFLYLPSAANILRERELHIERLEQELATKQEWLDKSLAEHATLVEQFRGQKAELEKANQWAVRLDSELKEKIRHVEILQQDAERLNRAFSDTCEELSLAVEQLHKTEAELDARTAWALQLDEEKQKILTKIQRSTWMRMGRAFKVGPDFRS